MNLDGQPEAGGTHWSVRFHKAYKAMSPEECAQVATAVVLVGERQCYDIFGYDRVGAVVLYYPPLISKLREKSEYTVWQNV